MASSEPIPVTRPRLLGACSIPTRELIFNASVTSSGARNSRLVPINASAYRVMKPHPTRRTTASSDSTAASVPRIAPLIGRSHHSALAGVAVWEVVSPAWSSWRWILWAGDLEGLEM